MTANEIEFLSEEEEVKIIPKFAMGVLRMIGVSFSCSDSRRGSVLTTTLPARSARLRPFPGTDTDQCAAVGCGVTAKKWALSYKAAVLVRPR